MKWTVTRMLIFLCLILMQYSSACQTIWNTVGRQTVSVSAQVDIIQLRKSHVRSAPSIGSPQSCPGNTTNVDLTGLSSPGSHLCEQKTPTTLFFPSSFLLVMSTVKLGSVLAQKAPQASQHARCQCIATGWGRKFDLQLLSQCGST